MAPKPDHLKAPSRRKVIKTRFEKKMQADYQCISNGMLPEIGHGSSRLFGVLRYWEFGLERFGLLEGWRLGCGFNLGLKGK